MSNDKQDQSRSRSERESEDENRERARTRRERAKSRKQAEESGEELGATAIQWGMACGNKSCVLSAQQELGDTGTAHGSDMRDMDHETCKSPTGNVSTNHLCSPRANFGYTR